MQNPKFDVDLPHAADRHTQRWTIGALIAATSASVVLSLSAWAGGEEGAPSSMPHGGMHMMEGRGGLPFSGKQLKHLLDEADATPAQRAQIKQIADKALADVKSLHEQGQNLHEQGLKLWAQPTLDAAAAEKLRQLMLVQHDKVSKRLLQAMMDVGQVLTPEQRVKLSDQLQKHHAHMMQRMRDHRPGTQARGAHGHRGEHQPQEQ